MHYFSFNRCISIASFLNEFSYIKNLGRTKEKTAESFLGTILYEKIHPREVFEIKTKKNVFPSSVSCVFFVNNIATSVSPGLSGSMNFDEDSEREDDAEEERSRSLSPKAGNTRPASAASGKDIPVSSAVKAAAANTGNQSGTPNNPAVLYPGAGDPRVAHRRELADGRGRPGGVRLASGSARRHRQMPNHPGQEGHGPRPLPHLLHAHGERGRQEGE